ncbi:MAG: ThuA domain-containing protein [Planctomycetales bacterium]|nr:ThuA domain-containing protein [Planctomycetales bacterium]
MSRLTLLALTIALTTTAPVLRAAEPLKALLITGGCCHDYEKQKVLLTEGISARANVAWTIVHEGGKSLDHKVSIYSQPNWAQGYDVVVHDECFANVKDVDFVEGILAAHREGVPSLNLHCAMHCYRTGTDMWFEYIGLQSSGHGPQKPIDVSIIEKHPITNGLSDWTTINEELYNNLKLWESAVPLARGKQGEGDKPGRTDCVVAWTNHYGPKKVPVFCTTLGHNNDTVADARYLDLVTRGLLWACGKLNDDGTPREGYGGK